MNEPLDPGISRFEAVGIHLAISIFIYLIVLYFIYFQWYPQPFFFADGGKLGALIVLGVHITSGPLLTAFIFRPKKPMRLIRFDLICIGIVQFIALCAGTYVVRDQRPIAVIHYKGAFYPITSGQLRTQGTYPSDLKRFGLEFPVLLHNEGPHVQAELDRIMFKSMMGIEEFRQIERFRSLKHHMDQVAKNSMDVRELARKNSKVRAALDRIVHRCQCDPGTLVCQAFKGRYGTVFLAFDDQGKLVGGIPAPQH